MAATINMFVERAAPGAVRGEHWRVSWFDRGLGRFVGGSGGNAFEALAWAIVNRIETHMGLVVIARNISDTPASRLRQLAAMRKAAPAKSLTITTVASAGTSLAEQRSNNKASRKKKPK